MLSRSESSEKAVRADEASLTCNDYLFGLKVSTTRWACKEEALSRTTGNTDSDPPTGQTAVEGEESSRRPRHFRRSEDSRLGECFALASDGALDRPFNRQVSSIKYHWRGTRVNCPGVFNKLVPLDDELEFVQDFSGKKVHPNHIFRRSAN